MKFKKYTVIIIAIIMVFSALAGCSGKNEPVEKSVSTPFPTVAPTPVPTPEPTPEPEYEYRAEFIPVKESPEYVTPRVFDGEGWYVTASEFCEADGSFLSSIYYVSEAGTVEKKISADAGYEICGVALDENQNLIYIESHFDSDEMIFTLVCSEEEHQISLEDGVSLNPAEMKISNEGNLYVLTDTGCVVLDGNGEVKNTVTFDGIPQGLIRLSDGTVEICGWKEEQLIIGDDVLPASAAKVFDGFGNYPYCYNDNIRFCSKGLDLFNWTSVDISVDDVTAICGGDELHCFLSRWNTDPNTYEYELARITCYVKGTAAEKKTLRLAAVDADYELQNLVVDFNRSNDDFRVELEIIPQEELSSCDADLFYLQGMDYYSMAENGLFEDLLPYYGDGIASQFPTITDALTVNGCLYATCPGFSISTLIGYPGIVGGTIGWSYEDYLAVMNNVAEGETIFNQEMISKDSVLHDYLGTFHGKVDENSDEYKKATAVADSVEGAPASTALLEYTSMFSYDDIILNDLKFDGQAVYAGLPTVNEAQSGNLLVLYPGFAIAKTCPDKDLAWKFADSFDSEEYQSKQWYFPSNINAFNAGLEGAMQVQYDGDEQIPRAVSYSESGVPTYYYAITAHQADELKEIISKAQAFVEY